MRSRVWGGVIARLGFVIGISCNVDKNQLFEIGEDSGPKLLVSILDL